MGKMKIKKLGLLLSSHAGIGGGGGVDIAATGCCSGCVFIWKKAIAINSAAIHMRMKPMAIIARNAPMSSRIAPVENRPTPVFAERALNDRLAR